MNYKLDTGAGDEFSKVAKKAKQIAVEREVTVEFEFNGVTCLVNENTNRGWLFRDYCNAHLMDWATVGPDCSESYTAEVQAELENRTAEKEKRQAEQQAKWDEEQRQKEAAISEKTNGLELEIMDAKVYQDWKDKNTDGYGGAIFRYAENWGKLMQGEISSGKTVAECAEETSRTADTEGLTGFMYGAAVSILSECWKHGAELKAWHNKEYNYAGEGVANPALLTIK